MILDFITLQNVGPFKGLQTVNISEPSPKRPVTTILALNGSGKTSLLEALRLGLYGRRSPSFVNGRGYSNYLRDAVHRHAETNEPSFVEIGFRLRTGGTLVAYRVRRQWEAKDSGASEQLEVYVDEQLNAALTDAWADTIEQWLPARLSSFCFFDGEQLAALADPEQSQQVLGDAIRALLGLDVVDQLSSDLRILDRRRKESSIEEDQLAAIAPLGQSVNQAEAQVQSLLHARGTLANQVERARLVMEEAERAMGNSGGHPLQQRERLQSRLEAAQEAVRTEHATLLEQAYGLAPLLLVRSNLERFKHQDPLVGTPRAAAELEQRDSWLISELEGISNEATVIRRVQRILARERKERSARASGCESSSHALELASNMDSVEASLARAVVQYSTAIEATEKLERKIEQLPAEDDPSSPHNVWRRAVVEHSHKYESLAQADHKLAEARRIREESLAKYQRAMEAGLRREHAERDGSLLADRSATIQSILVQFRRAMLERQATRLSELIADCFAQLHRKSDFVQQVRVDPETLSMALIATDGHIIDASRLSAGERQLLAVATIWAILRASGRPLPLVIDTPLGRLDSAHRQRLVDRFFMRAAHQVVLLATDTELDSEVSELLAPRTSLKYEINYVTADQRSEIRPIIEPTKVAAA